MIRKPAFPRLYDIAELQQGFFTTKQAVDAGYSDNTHPYHVKNGDWVRENRGIYRLVQFPHTDHPDLILWYLWSRDRNERPQGIFSHDTALSLYELSDLNPARIHMSIPFGFRRSAPVPKILVLHKNIIPERDISSMDGFKVTRPARTILDLLKEGSVSEDFIVQAIDEGLKNGKIVKKELHDITGWPYSVKEKLERIMRELHR